mgnify:CR=1 FL=1
MKKMYLVSFGDSGTFRYYDSAMETKTAEDIRRNIARDFPSLQNNRFFESEYAGYRLLDDQAIAKLERHIDKEIQSAQDVRTDNSNAPFDDIS